MQLLSRDTDSRVMNLDHDRNTKYRLLILYTHSRRLAGTARITALPLRRTFEERGRREVRIWCGTCPTRRTARSSSRLLGSAIAGQPLSTSTALVDSDVHSYSAFMCELHGIANCRVQISYWIPSQYEITDGGVPNQNYIGNLVKLEHGADNEQTCKDEAELLARCNAGNSEKRPLTYL